MSANHAAPDGEGGFAALCASLCEGGSGADFPLRGRLRMRSQISPAFQANDFKVEAKRNGNDGQSAEPTVWLGFLTLAGALPWWVTEKMLWERGEEGDALHAFLDLLNRRFWELLYLARRTGGDARYGGHRQAPGRLLAEFGRAVAGVREGAALPARIKQYGWLAARGTGGPAALSDLLTAVCRRAVRLREHVPVRVDIAHGARCFLGRLPHAAGGAIGSRTWLACGLLVTIALTDDDSMDAYLPGARGKRLALLQSTLQMAYGWNLPPVILQLRCCPAQASSRFGLPGLRLGWGAALGSSRPVSQLVRLSARAMSHKIG